MEENNPPRYSGTRWQIRYDTYDGVEEYAINTLQKILQSYLPYVIQVLPMAGESMPADCHLVLAGVVHQNPTLQNLLRKCSLPIPKPNQGFTLACTSHPEHAERRLLILAGGDANGLVYAVHELGKKLAQAIPLVGTAQPVDIHSRRAKLDGLNDFTISEYPRFQHRGLWTWGYVIHDYRGYLENMARLKMNLLITWNDVPPINYWRVREFAHQRGIQLILGFHWGWGIKDLRVTNPQHRAMIKADVLRNYRQNYQHLDLDGIYFQTITEHHDLTQDGISTAGGACLLVNDIASALFEINPNLKIYFGLHATSIRSHYIDLAPLDPRVVIMWEDAGSIPFYYDPIEDPAHPIEETIAYTKELAAFRPQGEFAFVPKGWSTLRWESEFEHHGPYILGEQDNFYNRQRAEERQTRWNLVNALWSRNYVIANRLYRELLSTTGAPLTAAGLVEDAYFELGIQPSVALFAESLWDPTRSEDTILNHAINAYYYR